MPELSDTEPRDVATVLSQKHGIPKEQARATNAQVTERGRQLGLVYRFDDAQAVGTRTAHRLSHFAAEHGRQHQMMQRLFRGYFTDGLNIADHGVLADLAADVGLDREAALAALATGAYQAEVDADLTLAKELGISGVPFFVFDGKYSISGAQPIEAFERALAVAWDEVVQRGPGGPSAS